MKSKEAKIYWFEETKDDLRKTSDITEGVIRNPGALGTLVA